MSRFLSCSYDVIDAGAIGFDGRLQPFVSGIAKDVGPMLSKMMEGEGALPVLKIREEVNKLMDDRLKVFLL